MSKKMYYSEEEAAEKLGVGVEALAEHVRQGKLHSYPDGDRKMYKAEEVDALAGGGEEEIELAAVDTGAVEGAKLSDADKAKPGGKEDTVITAEGISIFDEDDLEIEAADPMAKTQIAPSLEDQISIEGVGSGSGLLDLTRESDDTSLGAEVLDHIDMEGAVGEELGGEPVVEPVSYAPQAEPAVVEVPAYVEQIDASSGLFSGMIVGSAALAMLLVAVMVAAMTGNVPGYLAALKDNMAVAMFGCLLLVVATGVVGFLLGKSIAARQVALRRIGG